MKEMVIVFEPDGSVHHTLKDAFFNPAEALGATREIERMTDIKYSKLKQKFYIEFLRGTLADGTSLKECIVTINDKPSKELQIETTSHNVTEDAGDDPETELFDTYEDAVAEEIELVNRLRTQGAVFDK